MDAAQSDLSLHQALAIARRLLPWIVLCVVAAAGAAYGVSKNQTKKYTATAVLFFKSSQPSQQIVGLPSTPSNESQTNIVKLVQFGDVAAKTAHTLGRGLTAGDVSGAVSVSAQGESSFVNVSATAASRVWAEQIANTYAQTFVAEQQARRHASYANTRKLVEKQVSALSPAERAGPLRSELEKEARSLKVLEGLHEGPVQVTQAAAVPGSPSSPRIARNTALGALLGLLLGLGVASLIERFDRRIREPEDLGLIYRLPLLGVVPQSKALRRASQPGNRATRELLPPREEEAFHLIRAHLRYFNVERELRTLLVTSPASGDGKTTVARHLAVAAASVGQTVLLLEADLRHPSIAAELGIASGPGVADVVIGSVSLWRATQPVAIDSRAGVADRPLALDVLVAGAIRPPNPAQLIESPAMAAMLGLAKETYDLVVLDSSPLLVVSDAFPLLRVVDGVVVVGRVGRNRRPGAERLQETLDGVGAPLLGVIANGVKARLRGPHYDQPVAGETRVRSDGAADHYGRPGAESSLSGERSERVDGPGRASSVDSEQPAAEPVSEAGS
jgi:capsular exopolysaccharide synthesis family protein